MRPIDADALKEFIDDCGICAICPQKAPRCSYDCDFPDFVTEKWNVAIDAQPTIDAVSVVRGEWIDRSDGGRILHPWWESYECMNCGYSGSKAWNFCPNCGADMRGNNHE